MQPLRPYQEKAIEAFVAGEYQYLSADAGTGKSRMAIEIASRLKAKRVLVICPASVKLSWVAELQKWAPHAKYHCPVTPSAVGTFKTHDRLWTIINYDKIARGDAFVQALIKAGPYDLLVGDEFHYCKNLMSKRSRVVYRQLMPVCTKTLPMSATPMTRCASDLYAPLRFLKPEAVTDKHGRLYTLHAFEDRHAIVNMRRIGPRLVREVSGSRNIEELQGRMDGFFYRLKKEECLPELPPMQFEQLPIGLDREDYAPIKDAIGDIDIDDDEDLLAAAMQSAHIMTAMRLIGLAKVPCAAQYITDYLEDNDLKVVVWAKHIEVIDALYAKLSRFNPAGIDGRMHQSQREHAVSAFLNVPNTRVFIGQIHAAGTGLTLLTDTVQPRDAFFVESDWSPANNYQAASRIHRLGQRDGVLCRVFTAQGVPLDMRLQRVLTRKMSEFEQLIDGEKI